MTLLCSIIITYDHVTTQTKLANKNPARFFCHHNHTKNSSSVLNFNTATLRIQVVYPFVFLTPLLSINASFLLMWQPNVLWVTRYVINGFILFIEKRCIHYFYKSLKPCHKFTPKWFKYGSGHPLYIRFLFVLMSSLLFLHAIMYVVGLCGNKPANPKSCETGASSIMPLAK